MDRDTTTQVDALRTLAFVGDTSMGQPTDHSCRVAWIAYRLACSLGLESASDVIPVALLRWSGCTANAGEVAQTISDDIAGRAAMLSLQPERISVLVPPETLEARISEISAIHCEVSAVIGEALGLNDRVVLSLRCVFEHWDGSGKPLGLSKDAIPAPMLVVAVAGDLDILSRVYGPTAALNLLQQRADSIYPARLVEACCRHGSEWLAELDNGGVYVAAMRALSDDRSASLSLIADVIDLKLPWLNGQSRAVSAAASSLAGSLGLDATSRDRVRRAGLLHGLGRVAVPNAVWDRSGPLSAADWERVRLWPYWTARAARNLGRLEAEAELASHVCERVDGSGYFRAMHQHPNPIEARVLPVALAWVAMTSPRPWRDAISETDALKVLADQAAQGTLDERVVACIRRPGMRVGTRATVAAGTRLSDRELQILRRVSLGDSNKVAAAMLGVSPATVRTHMESIFRKLDCKTRAAATLKATILGLL